MTYMDMHTHARMHATHTQTNNPVPATDVLRVLMFVSSLTLIHLLSMQRSWEHTSPL